MRNALIVLPFVLALAPAPAASADLKAGGYFSLDFRRGQAASSSPQGSFESPLAGLLLAGKWTDRFVYALEVRSRENMRFDIEQAWAGFVWSEAVRIKIGLFLVPFGRFNTAARPFETPLVQAPLPVAVAFPASWRELGLLAEGSSGFLRYAAWIGNGLAEARDLAAGQQFRDNNANKGWGGRLGFALSQSFEAGGSYYTGKVSSSDGRLLTMKGADAVWSDGGLKLAAEYCRADIANPAPFAAGTAEGYFLLGSLDLGGLSLVASHQSVKYSDTFHGPGFTGPGSPGLGLAEDRRIWSIGLTAALAAGLLLKAEYDFNREPNLELRNDVFRAQVAAHF